MNRQLGCETVVGLGLVLLAAVQSACTFITACPNNNGGNTAGASGGGQAGAENQAGSGGGGVIMTAPVPTGAWINATSNLAGVQSECGNLSGLIAKPDEDLLVAGV